MTYKYYNQNNYANYPYASSANPKATIKSGGCGPTSMAMIVSNMTTKIVDPIAMAKYAIAKGARVSGGTDVNTLSRNVCKDYSLTYSVTSDENTLLRHLQTGNMAIANVGGNRGNYLGVFSDGGHFIVVAGINNNGKIIVLDPGYYNGKFNKVGRKGKVIMNGNECICDISVLAKDTENRSPAYWLFERKVEEVPEWMKKIMIDAKNIGLITGEHNPLESATKWFVLAIALNVIKIIKGGK